MSEIKHTRVAVVDRLREMEELELRECLASLIDDLFGYDDEETCRSLDPGKEWLGDVQESVAATLRDYGLMPSHDGHEPSTFGCEA